MGDPNWPKRRRHPKGRGWSEYFGDREDLTAEMHRSASREVAFGTTLLGIAAIGIGATIVGEFCNGAIDPASLAIAGATLLGAGVAGAMRQNAKDGLERIRDRETRDWERVQAGWSLEPGEKVPPGYTPPVKKETEPFKLREDCKTSKPGAKPYSPQ